MANHTIVNRQANAILMPLYRDKGIISCEIQGQFSDDRPSNCTGQMFLGWAHRHKRGWYWERGRDTLALLSSFNETILACTNCHNAIEHDKTETYNIFNKLRGDLQKIF